MVMKMTNEEALKIIKQPGRVYAHQISATDEDSQKFNQENIEALNKAINLLEQQPCDDCVSRQAVLDLMQLKMGGKELYKAVYELPPVTPTRKVGKWIKTGGSFRCSECIVMPEFTDIRTLKYCPNCGVKMVGADLVELIDIAKGQHDIAAEEASESDESED